MESVPGLSKKQLAALKKAGVDTPAKLRARIRSGKLPPSMPKLNPTTSAYLEHRPKKSVPLHVVNRLVATLKKSLKVKGKGPLAQSRIILVGSGRRQRPTVKDIDILLVPPDSWRTTHPDVLSRLEVEPFRTEDPSKMFRRSLNVLANYASGERRRSMILQEGGSAGPKYRVDFFLAWETEKPYALMHYTGSWRYNVRVRAHAKARGWKLNQYGVFLQDHPNRRVRGSAKIKTEGDLARFLGVTPRPAHLREK